MNDKMNLLEQAVKKASTDKAYISYYMVKYSVIEKKMPEEIRSILNCSLEDYYMLCLCKAPEAGKFDFVERLNKISEYNHVSMIELNKIIKKVSALEKFSNTNNYNTSLMAARDKETFEKDSEDTKDNENKDS